MLRKAIEFGLYPWFPAHGYSYIHPANRRDFEALSPNGKVFEKLDENDKWILLQYADKQFKVSPDLYSSVYKLPFSFGDTVEEINRTPGQLRQWGIIAHIYWNYSEDRPYFRLRQGKKILEQEFTTEQLRKI